MESNDAKWNREIANIIWKKLKGIGIPDSYTDREVSEILARYWHRACECE